MTTARPPRPTLSSAGRTSPKTRTAALHQGDTAAGPQRNAPGRGRPAVVTIVATMEEFTRARVGRSPRTAVTYAQGLRVFARYLQDAEGIDPTRETPMRLETPMLAAFYTWLSSQETVREEPYRPASARLYLTAARTYLVEQVLTDRAPAVNLPKMDYLLTGRLPKNIYEQVNPSPLIPLIVGYYDRQPEPRTAQTRLIWLRNRAILHTLYSTALRIAECASLRRSQLDTLEGGIADELSVRGKGGKVRKAYLTEEARAALESYLAARGQDGHPHVFISHGRGKGCPDAEEQSPSALPARSPSTKKATAKTARPAAARPLTTRHLWEIVHRAALACGAPDVHPHLFRHFRASHWLTDGMALERVQELLGHQDIGITRKVYAHLLGSAVKDAFFAHHPPAIPTEQPGDASPVPGTSTR